MPMFEVSQYEPATLAADSDSILFPSLGRDEHAFGAYPAEYQAAAEAVQTRKVLGPSCLMSADDLCECFHAHADNGEMAKVLAVTVLRQLLDLGGERVEPTVAGSSNGGARDEPHVVVAVSRHEAMRNWIAEQYFRVIDVSKV
jgi:hypothetical protein